MRHKIVLKNREGFILEKEWHGEPPMQIDLPMFNSMPLPSLKQAPPTLLDIDRQRFIKQDEVIIHYYEEV